MLRKHARRNEVKGRLATNLGIADIRCESGDRGEFPAAGKFAAYFRKIAAMLNVNWLCSFSALKADSANPLSPRAGN